MQTPFSIFVARGSIFVARGPERVNPSDDFQSTTAPNLLKSRCVCEVLQNLWLASASDV